MSDLHFCEESDSQILHFQQSRLVFNDTVRTIFQNKLKSSWSKFAPRNLWMWQHFTLKLRWRKKMSSKDGESYVFALKYYFRCLGFFCLFFFSSQSFFNAFEVLFYFFLFTGMSLHFWRLLGGILSNKCAKSTSRLNLKAIHRFFFSSNGIKCVLSSLVKS